MDRPGPYFGFAPQGSAAADALDHDTRSPAGLAACVRDPARASAGGADVLSRARSPGRSVVARVGPGLSRRGRWAVGHRVLQTVLHCERPCGPAVAVARHRLSENSVRSTAKFGLEPLDLFSFARDDASSLSIHLASWPLPALHRIDHAFSQPDSHVAKTTGSSANRRVDRSGELQPSRRAGRSHEPMR